MGFQEVQSLDCEVTVALGGVNKKTGKANPTKIEGYYLGARIVPDKKKKSGESHIYAFQTENGNVGVWGKTDLDRKMTSVAPGTMTQITQSGTRETPNGPMYLFKVAVDKCNTIEVDAALATQSSGSEPEYSDEVGTEDYSSDQPEEPQPYVPPKAAAKPAVAPTAAAQSRVQDLLRNRNKTA